MKTIEFVKPILELVKDQNQPEDEFYAKLKISPLDRGYGMTIGNSLRRVLMSSLPGAAAVAMKIDGVAHEFCAVPGIREDVTEIILNVKQIIFTIDADKNAKGEFASQKELLEVYAKIENKSSEEEMVVKASDLDLNGLDNVCVINGDQIICTLAPKGKLDMTLLIRCGVGYVSNMENKVFCKDHYDRLNGFLPIDSIFTPVTRCKYEVSKTRYQDNFDCDQLLLEVWTDGSITAMNAISLAAKFLEDHFKVIEALNINIAEKTYMAVPEEEKSNKVLDMRLEELNIKSRSYHCLIRNNIYTVGELIQKTEAEMIKIPSLGRKSLKQIEECLNTLGLELKNGSTLYGTDDGEDEDDE